MRRGPKGRLQRRATYLAAKAAIPCSFALSIMEHKTMAHLNTDQRQRVAQVITEVSKMSEYCLEPNICFVTAQALTVCGRDIEYFEGVVQYGNDPRLYHHGWNRIDGTDFDVSTTILVTEHVAHKDDLANPVYKGQAVPREVIMKYFVDGLRGKHDQSPYFSKQDMTQKYGDVYGYDGKYVSTYEDVAYPALPQLNDEQRQHIHKLISQSKGQFENNRCFGNASDMVKGDTTGRIRYVEGVFTTHCDATDCPCLPTHHAWNTIDGMRFDVTDSLNNAQYGGDPIPSVYRGEELSHETFNAWKARQQRALDDCRAFHSRPDVQARVNLLIANGALDRVKDEDFADAIDKLAGYQNSADACDCYFTTAQILEKFGEHHGNGKDQYFDRVEWFDEREDEWHVEPRINSSS